MPPAEALSRALLEHVRNEKRDKTRQRSPKQEKRGDVVVIQDQGSIVTRTRPENLFDIVASPSVTFTPAGAGYAVASSDEAEDVYGSDILDIHRADESAEVVLGFPFSFFGQTYDSVGSFFYFDNPRFVSTPRGVTPPASGICGTRITLTVADIVAHPEMGPRFPVSTDEDDGHGIDVKTMAFVLLTMSDDHEEALKRVDTFRRAWQVYGNGIATQGRGRFETGLKPRIY